MSKKSPIPGSRDDPYAWVGVELGDVRLGKFQSEDFWGRTYAIQGGAMISRECVLLDQQWARGVRVQEAFVRHMERLEEFVHPYKPLFLESGLAPVRLLAPTPFVVREHIPQTSLALLAGAGKERLEHGFVFAVARQIADLLDAAAHFRTHDGTPTPLVHGCFRSADVRLTVHNGVTRITLAGLERLPFLAAAATQAFANVRTQVVSARDAAWLASVAPELILEQGEQGQPADAQTDVYCLGMLLFEVLAGRLPATPERGETGEAFLNRFHAAKRQNTVRLCAPDVPEGLSELIGRCLLPRKERPANVWSVVLGMAEILKADPRDPLFDTLNMVTVKRVVEEERAGLLTPKLPPPTTTPVVRHRSPPRATTAPGESWLPAFVGDGRIVLIVGMVIAAGLAAYAIVFQSAHWFGRRAHHRTSVSLVRPLLRPVVSKLFAPQVFIEEVVDAGPPEPTIAVDAGPPAPALQELRRRCYAAVGFRTERQACAQYQQLVPSDSYLERLRQIRRLRRTRPGRAPSIEPDHEEPAETPPPPTEQTEPPTSVSAPSP